MKLDFTLKLIILEIKQEIKEEYDVEYSDQEIAAIADSQFKAAMYAINRGLDFRLEKFMRFKRIFKVDYLRFMYHMKLLKPLLNHETYMEMFTFGKKMIANNKKEIERSKKQITLDEFLEADIMYNYKFLREHDI